MAIARALVTEPSVLLADEPTGNLDSVSGEAVLRLLEELNAERGVALAVVTHDPAVAARARRQDTMRDGLIVGRGPVTLRRGVAGGASTRCGRAGCAAG